MLDILLMVFLFLSYSQTKKEPTLTKEKQLGQINEDEEEEVNHTEANEVIFSKKSARPTFNIQWNFSKS